MIDSSLRPEQHQQVERLLEKYSDIFTYVSRRTQLIEQHIQTTSEQPIHQSPYVLPEALKSQVKADLAQMLSQGVIRPSTSAWNSPIVLVEQKDRSIRLRVDYRCLNSITVSDAYPIPRLDAVVEKVGNSEYISSIDLSEGYWQIHLNEDTQKKSAFVTPFGLYEFVVMPFGMETAPSTFARLMDKLLEGADGFADSYFDDVSVFSTGWHSHMEHLKGVFQ